jgi:hypothetical protein
MIVIATSLALDLNTKTSPGSILASLLVQAREPTAIAYSRTATRVLGRRSIQRQGR